MREPETPSSEGTDSLSDLRPRPLNFSRPRPVTANSKERLLHDRTGSSQTVRGINAFHDPIKDNLPEEPRFSIDSDRADSTRSSENSVASEFAWDDELGGLRSKRRPKEYEQNQRYAQSSSRSRSNASGSQTSTDDTTPGSDKPLLPSELPGSLPPPRAPAPLRTNKPPPAPRIQTRLPLQPQQKQQPPSQTRLPAILKRTSVEQASERASLSSRDSVAGPPGANGAQGWEDTASHHTMSILNGSEGSGGGGSMTSSDGISGLKEEGKWSSSSYDVSGLSPAEIRKLQKKGINPALYAEMKAARKGKGKWVGPLVGNTFIGYAGMPDERRRHALLTKSGIPL
ncbi:hypothetical protein LTR78_006254 [Recurvomyces mirabilis]|uniref:Uncharacterized protein n=1 Tax=Recurvomyces mirabilis TaxID=574656 RepID=A0AAE1BZZ8_9PEZI|nr:hypothetical protein LTR78_006254 [Recurvomyces mirabilis]KAK5152143.1 hypothetical protein LTS14_008518 [Recurvomyces mirabilis]